ncbi:type II toxin-antitoxin system RelE/ParE family toxin [Hypericibacter sp.]|uniref:type II toxin-antitoxin system RelE/ParE family toxin n=1 Tax=Hypericibacter sp. TaxID=2705401 RepID=UPI003D6CE05B
MANARILDYFIQIILPLREDANDCHFIPFLVYSVARHLIPGERPLDWVGSSKEDFLAFPRAVKAEMGNALGVAQFGGLHPSAKPWKGQGPGIFELVEDHRGNSYRAVYTVRFAEVIYVLHAFQKKSPHGIRTANTDIELIQRRLKTAHHDHETRYRKAKG